MNYQRNGKLGRYRYKLLGPVFEATSFKGVMFRSEFIHLTKDGRILISTYYSWDGPSGPTFDTDDFMLGSLVHDALYQVLREFAFGRKERRRLRKAADKDLRRICIREGMSKLRASWVYWGVRIFGRRAAMPRD